MHERVGAEARETPEPAVVPTPRQGAVVERMLALQRNAGNAAVNRLIARQPAGLGIDTTPTRFVFILGAQDDEALEVATQHYRSILMSDVTRRVITRDDMKEDPSLNGVLIYLSRFKHPISEITLVVHGNDEGEILLPLSKEDTTPDRTTPDELEEAMSKGVLQPLNGGQITSQTRIRLQACFSGTGPRMVNLLDKAIGDGFGQVIAPTVEVAYANDIWHSEGLSGWILTSPKALTLEEITVGLKAKFAKAVGPLDRSTYQEDTGPHRKGESFKDDDEMWAEIARNAQESDRIGPDGKTEWLYISRRFFQGVKPGYENDPVLYTKSTYYAPEDI